MRGKVEGGNGRLYVCKWKERQMDDGKGKSR